MHFINPFKGLRATEEKASSVIIIEVAALVIAWYIMSQN
jgi:hypothetical protein